MGLFPFQVFYFLKKVFLSGFFNILENFYFLIHDFFAKTVERNEGKTGVWIDVSTPFPRKICAMGVRASRWVTMHGFALNANVDFRYFDNIIPCGLANNIITSISKETNKEKIDYDKLKAIIKKNFLNIFQAEII